jgi:hypothetical protein
MASVFESSFLFFHSSVNSQPKTSKVGDDTLGSSNQFSAAEKDEGRVIYRVGLEEREHCPLGNVLYYYNIS